jgi:hypothetical protein
MECGRGATGDFFDIDNDARSGRMVLAQRSGPARPLTKNLLRKQRQQQSKEKSMAKNLLAFQSIVHKI